MRWRDGRRSSNVDDRRQVRLSGKAKGGGIGIILLALVGMYFGIDPAFILQQGANLSGPAVQQSEYVPSAEENELADFVSGHYFFRRQTQLCAAQAGTVYRLC